MKKLSIFALLVAMMLMVASIGLAADGQEVVLHRGYAAAHGDKCFTRVVVAVAGDKIVGVALDEFQYMAPGEGVVAVPNSDKGFGQGAQEGKVLVSKRASDVAYSKNMAEKAKATMNIAAGYDVIEAFAVGKTVAEIEAVIAAGEPGKPVDAVSGATLVDTVGYLQAIVDVAKNDSYVSKGMALDASKILLKAAQGAPHGDKSFGDAVVALEEGNVIAASIDEFQYFAGEGVPNSDKGFGTSYADAAKPLASKLVNNEAYSKNMAEKAKATTLLADGYKAIEAFATGKTGQEIKDFTATQEAGKPVDAVTGATLVDTVGYLNLLADAALAE